MAKHSIDFYVNRLISTVCFCDRRKSRGNAFCHYCYSRLDYGLQASLLSRIGAGFEDAYDAAIVVLISKGSYWLNGKERG